MCFTEQFLHVCVLLSTVKKQQKFLRAKYGGIEDEMHDDEEEDKEGKKDLWGGIKNQYYYGDNRDFEVRIECQLQSACLLSIILSSVYPSKQNLVNKFMLVFQLYNITDLIVSVSYTLKLSLTLFKFFSCNYVAAIK